MSEDSIYFIRDKAEYIDPREESHNILFGWMFASAMKDFVGNNLYLNSLRIDPKSASEGISGLIYGRGREQTLVKGG